MTDKAKCLCQNCKSEILVDYQRLGVLSVCHSCQRATIPQIPEGGAIPVNGKQLTYLEFISLLADTPAYESISNYLLINFNYKLAQINKDYFIFNQSKEAVDKLWLHLKIQQHPQLSGDLYNLAMSLWRS